MGFLDLFPLNLHSFLNVLTVVLALVLAGLVLRLVLRVTRAVFTVGCLGIGAVAIVLAVVVFVVRG